MASDFFGEGPVCVATLICNEVIEDKRSGNKTVVGIFNAVGATSLPATHPRMTIMTSITNVDRELPLKLLMRGPEGKELVQADATVPGRNPGDVIDLLFELNSITFTEFGDHTVEIRMGDQTIGARRFQVILHRAS